MCHVRLHLTHAGPVRGSVCADKVYVLFLSGTVFQPLEEVLHSPNAVLFCSAIMLQIESYQMFCLLCQAELLRLYLISTCLVLKIKHLGNLDKGRRLSLYRTV